MKTGGNAFPIAITRDPDGGVFDPRGYGADGMDLRDYFAARAAEYVNWNSGTTKINARRCYEIADALLEASETP